MPRGGSVKRMGGWGGTYVSAEAAACDEISDIPHAIGGRTHSRFSPEGPSGRSATDPASSDSQQSLPARKVTQASSPSYR